MSYLSIKCMYYLIPLTFSFGSHGRSQKMRRHSKEVSIKILTKTNRVISYSTFPLQWYAYPATGDSLGVTLRWWQFNINILYLTLHTTCLGGCDNGQLTEYRILENPEPQLVRCVFHAQWFIMNSTRMAYAYDLIRFC